MLKLNLFLVSLLNENISYGGKQLQGLLTDCLQGR